MSLTNTIVEGDSTQIIEKLNNVREDFSDVDTFIEEDKLIMRLMSRAIFKFVQEKEMKWLQQDISRMFVDSKLS